MSEYTVRIKAEGIGKAPEYLESNREGYTSLRLNGNTFELYNLVHDDNELVWIEGAYNNDSTEVLNTFMSMFPNTEFQTSFYCHDGYGHTEKCGIYNGKYLEWERFEYDYFGGEEG